MAGDGFHDFAAHLARTHRVEREIGRGGWGLVYTAWDLRHDRRVAIKLLRGEHVESVSSARFRHEIEILSRLEHPNIVALYDWGEFRGAPWYAMSYVDGESLKDRLAREGPLPVGDALRISLCVAGALTAAHAAHVVHRDIQPGNILLDGERVMVVDFGIARAMSTSASLDPISAAGLRIGTPVYMSPEQGSAAQDLDGRSDIYSLGCVLYEMLSGQPPFSGTNSNQLLARHALDPVPPLRGMRRSVPRSVEDVVYKALGKTPADRFASAEDFFSALEAVSRESNGVFVRLIRLIRRAAGRRA